MSDYPSVQKNTELIIRELENRFPALFSRCEAPARPVVIAIDGRCASGKSTLAAALKAALEDGACGSVDLFHMDDFYLRPEQRTAERFAESGGNVDRERFLEEVLEPLLRGEAFAYRPFDCGTMALRGPVAVPKARLAIVEGSYSCHPLLRGNYDLRVFLSVGPAEQRRRLLQRNGEERLRLFEERWIPFEERYFADCGAADCCELRLCGE